MEGSPWLRIFLVLAGFLILGIPVWTITRPKDAAATTASASASPTPAPVAATSHLALTFSTPPEHFTLKYLGATVLEGRGPQREFQTDWTAALPKEGADLLLEIDWPTRDTSPSAARLVITRDTTTLTDQTVWGQGNQVETITVNAQP